MAKMVMGNKDYYCPLLQKDIYEGLCWEICFANIAIKLEGISEFQNFLSRSNKYKTVEDAHKVCAECVHCQWATK